MMLGRMVFFSVSALWVLSEKERMVLIMNIKMDKIEELLSTLKKKEDEKQKNTVLWVLAIIGAVAAVAGIAFAVYRFFAPD